MMKKLVFRWVPAAGIMALIFVFSSIPSREMIHFGALDLIIRKSGHVLGFGLLAMADWYGLRFKKRLWWLALLLAMLYAVIDEFHQSFVPGRTATWVDVMAFDTGGAAITLGLFRRLGHP
jgi:hypothetical protein